MATNSNTSTVKRTRRAASTKTQPAIDPNERPTVEAFDANPEQYPLWVKRNESSNGTPNPIIVRKVAATAMALPTGIVQPTDADGVVIRVKSSHTKDDDRLIESTVELLATFPEARKSWVVALRTARWTRAQGVKRADGSDYSSCTTARWGTNSKRGIFHVAMDRFMALDAKPAKKAPAKRAAKPTTAKRTAKSSAA